MNSKISRRNFLKATAASALGVAASAAIGTQTQKALAEEPEFKQSIKPVVPGVAGVVDRAALPTLAWDDPTVALKVRWSGVNFYEFVLPDGTAIVMDPYFDDPNDEHNEFKYTPTDLPGGEWVYGADYVLLTHGHFDHTGELGSVLQKYPAAHVILPENTLPSVVIKQKINYSGHYFSEAGAHDLFELHGFKLETIRSNHNCSKFPVADELDTSKYVDENGKVDFYKLHAMIYEREIMNMKITTDTGFTVLIWNSEMHADGYGFETRPYFYKNAQPDLFMYQVAGASLGYDRRNPTTDHMGNWIASVQAKAALPEHQQHFSYDELDSMATAFAENCNAQQVGTQFLTPETGVWYGYVKNGDGSVSVCQLENP